MITATRAQLAQCFGVDPKEDHLMGKEQAAVYLARHFEHKNGRAGRTRSDTEVARPEGFEPSTPGVEARCSDPLSQGR